MGVDGESMRIYYRDFKWPELPRIPTVSPPEAFLFFYSHFLFLFLSFYSFLLFLAPLFCIFSHYIHIHIHIQQINLYYCIHRGTSAPAKLSSECPAELPSLSIYSLWSILSSLPLFPIFYSVYILSISLSRSIYLRYLYFIDMPPRSSLSSFSVTDASNEVVCPLKNNDGSNCRKRCLGVCCCRVYRLISSNTTPGKTLSLDAGAYPARSSKPLHS